MRRFSLVNIFLICALVPFAQQAIPLPAEISGPEQELSGLAIHDGRLYLLPQYGDRRDKQLKRPLYIYSTPTDSVESFLSGKSTVLNNYRRLPLRLPKKLQRSIAHYQGFEAMVIVGRDVFFSIETDDEKTKDCYILKGRLKKDGSRVRMKRRMATLHRPFPTPNGGFESLAWLPSEKKLLALFEFNGAASGGKAFLLHPSLKRNAQPASIPPLLFRLTDAYANDTSIIALNYFWNGDHKDYLQNSFTDPGSIDTVASLKPLLEKNKDLPRDPAFCFTRIIKLNGLSAKKWEELAVLETACSATNWEGLVPFGKGFLLVSDANAKNYLKTALVYFEAK